jgi:esterase/lipase superfamily enzyme
MREHAVDVGGGTVIGYGHWGRPMLVFPSEQGRAWDFAANGMVGAVADLIEAHSWADRSVPLEERARRHATYESWIVGDVLPHVSADSGGAKEFGVLGASMGAFHALNFAVKRADLFPLALCFSGNYDPSAWHGWGERGEATYFNNPSDYLTHLHGDHLEWLRQRLSLVLVCGQGQWEDTTGALASTRHIAGILASKGIRYELDLWGHDVPHDWPSWRRQLAHHLPRFC